MSHTLIIRRNTGWQACIFQFSWCMWLFLLLLSESRKFKHEEVSGTRVWHTQTAKQTLAELLGAGANFNRRWSPQFSAINQSLLPKRPLNSRFIPLNYLWMYFCCCMQIFGQLWAKTSLILKVNRSKYNPCSTADVKWACLHFRCHAGF